MMCLASQESLLEGTQKIGHDERIEVLLVFPVASPGAIPSVLQSIIMATNIPSRQYKWREASIPLPEDLVRTLAEHARVAVREIQDMVAKCILCKQKATVSVVGINENIWQGKSKSGKLPVVLYGLCKPCSDQPKAVEKAKAAAFESFTILPN